MEQIIYDASYFIKKFEPIPEHMWHTGELVNEDKTKRCALGHCCPHYQKPAFFCGEGKTKESNALTLLFENFKMTVAMVNDDNDSRYEQPTPKQRILAALRDIKNLEEKTNVKEQPKVEYPDITKQLAVLPEEKIEVDVVVKKIKQTLG